MQGLTECGATDIQNFTVQKGRSLPIWLTLYWTFLVIGLPIILIGIVAQCLLDFFRLHADWARITRDCYRRQVAHLEANPKGAREIYGEGERR